MLAQARTLTRTSASRVALAVQAPALAGALLLGGLIVLAFAVRSWLNTRVEAPWIFGDELTYSEMAKSFAAGHGFEVRGTPPNTRTLYPILISPAWLTDSVESAFVAVKAINTALMTLACVPLYLWARRLVSEGFAVAAAALLLLLPAFAYTGTIMTENGFLLLFLLALYALARALETPTLVWQLSAVALVLPAVAVRVQGLVLLAVLVTAIALDSLVAASLGERRLRGFLVRLRAFTATGVALFLLFAVYVVYAFVSYSALSQGLGGYSGLAQLDFTPWNGVRWTVFHAGELVLAVGFLPASAFLILAGAWLRPSARPAERAFVAVTAAALLWIVPVAGFYASRYSQRIEERSMFYLEPLLLLALVAWVARGAPRAPRWTAVAVGIPAALLVAIPFERLFNISATSDTFALLPLMRVSALIDGGADATRVLLALGAAAAALLFVCVSRRLAGVTIGAVAVFLALSAWSVAGTLRDQANATRRETHTTNADWIDERVGPDADVPFIFTDDLVANAHLLWQTEFWNRSVGTVYGLNAADPTSIPVLGTTVDGTGRIVRATGGQPLSPRFVVAQPWMDIAGQRIAVAGRLALYRSDAPLRLRSDLKGVYADGWSGASATYTNYGGRSDSLLVDVGRAGWTGPDTPGQVAIVVERVDSGKRLSTTRWVVHSGKKRTFRLQTPTAPYRVRVDVPTFSPAQFGRPDARQLGVQLAFKPE